jgi:hypothetical protein
VSDPDSQGATLFIRDVSGFYFAPTRKVTNKPFHIRYGGLSTEPINDSLPVLNLDRFQP